jgi:hypothetical protein
VIDQPRGREHLLESARTVVTTTPDSPRASAASVSRRCAVTADEATASRRAASRARERQDRVLPRKNSRSSRASSAFSPSSATQTSVRACAARARREPRAAEPDRPRTPWRTRRAPRGRIATDQKLRGARRRRGGSGFRDGRRGSVAQVLPPTGRASSGGRSRSRRPGRRARARAATRRSRGRSGLRGCGARGRRRLEHDRLVRRPALLASAALRRARSDSRVSRLTATSRNGRAPPTDDTGRPR